jgi:hypothetical protein
MLENINKTDAVISLKSGAIFVYNDGVLDWQDSEQTAPTSAEIDAEVIRLQTIQDGQAYARTRKAKYDLLNQDEMRYDDLKNSTTTWVDAIDAIKAAHPKP